MQLDFLLQQVISKPYLFKSFYLLLFKKKNCFFTCLHCNFLNLNQFETHFFKQQLITFYCF